MGDPNSPCDFTPNTVGNGGLYDSMEEAEDVLIALGFNAQSNAIGAVNYNDGIVKYTFSY